MTTTTLDSIEAKFSALHIANQAFAASIAKGRELMYYTKGMYNWSRKTAQQVEAHENACKTLLKFA